MSLVTEAQVDDVPEGKHVIAILDKTGDTKIIWDPTNEVEVENARRTFDDMKAKGFTAYSVNRRGDKDAVVREFDPDAQKLILTPALVGG